MKDNYDDLNETFNTELEVQQVTEAGCIRRKDAMTDITDDAEKDYNDDQVIDAADNMLIEPGDDFGFTESREFFGDSKEYSPTRKVDI